MAIGGVVGGAAALALDRMTQHNKSTMNLNEQWCALWYDDLEFCVRQWLCECVYACEQLSWLQVTSIWTHHLTKNKLEALDTHLNRNSFTTSTIRQIRKHRTIHTIVRVCMNSMEAISKKFTYQIFMYFVCILHRKRHILDGLLRLLLLPLFVLLLQRHKIFSPINSK